MMLRRYYNNKKNVTTSEDLKPKVEDITSDNGETFTSGDDSKGVEVQEETNLEELSKTKLKELAKEAKVKGYTTMEEEQLIEALRGE